MMKKTILSLLCSVLLCSCGKETISPEITIFKPQEQPIKKHYPLKLTWLYAEGDTLFKDTLILTHPYSEHLMTETSVASYDFSFPIWQISSIAFVGKIGTYNSITINNPNQTKSVTYKLLN